MGKPRSRYTEPAPGFTGICDARCHPLGGQLPLPQLTGKAPAAGSHPKNVYVISLTGLPLRSPTCSTTRPIEARLPLRHAGQTRRCDERGVPCAGPQRQEDGPPGIKKGGHSNLLMPPPPAKGGPWFGQG